LKKIIISEKMNRIIFIVLSAYLLQQQVLCQGVQEFFTTTENSSKKSMLGMLSKYIEINGTIEQVIKSSMTDNENVNGLGRLWFNATERPIPPGVCEREEEFTEEVIFVEKIPYQVEVEVWCWSIRCTEWETHYREEKKVQNVTKTRLVELV
jgi:hypothetical protein